MIGAIENAILAKLEAAGGPSGFVYDFATLQSSPDDWEALFAELARTVRTPAAWVGFYGWDRTVREDSGLVRCEGGRFVLVVLARSLRNGADVRQAANDALNPGSYQLLQDVTACLVGFDDDALAMNPLRAGKSWQINRSKALRDNKLSAFAVELVTDFWIEPQAGGEAVPFTHFHADWDIPPLGEGRDGTPIGGDPRTGPDPDNADAADDVFLPGAPA